MDLAGASFQRILSSSLLCRVDALWVLEEEMISQVLLSGSVIQLLRCDENTRENHAEGGFILACVSSPCVLALFLWV